MNARQPTAQKVWCVFAQAFCSQKSFREITLNYAKSPLNYAKLR